MPQKRAVKRHTARKPRRKHDHHLCPKISRSRLRSLRDTLDSTRSNLDETLKMYWFIPENDVRLTLANTHRLIAETVSELAKAA